MRTGKMDYELQDLTIGYGSKTVAASINATLQGGQLTCLLGPNGAGKSTLLRTLSAFQPPLGGSLLLRDSHGEAFDVQGCRASELSRLMGIVLTDRVSIQGMSVRQLVGMGRTPYTNFWGSMKEEDEHIVEKAIGLCGIEALAHRPVTTLSDGERQKAMIAKALAQQTPVILLDEPTAFLDFPSKVDTMLLLARLAHEEGKAILLSTHDLDQALQTADQLWLMGEGQLRVGSPRQLAESGILPHFFQGKHIAFDAAQLRFCIRQNP